MQVELTIRASIARDMAKGKWKRRLEELLSDFEIGKSPPGKPLKFSPPKPDVYLAEVDDHWLVFHRSEEVIKVMDIMPIPGGNQ